MLRRLEALGNRLPDPTVLFLLLGAAVLAASKLLSGASVAHPATGQVVAVADLLDRAGLRRIATEAIANFVGFPPLGTVLVAMLGIGLAERTGLVAAAMTAGVEAVPRRWMTPALAFVGANSAIAADAGFVVLVPLGAALWAQAGRPPLAGMALAFASVSGGYGANILVTALDPLLAGLSTAAARLVDPAYTVTATANWWFNIASALLVTVVCSLVALRLEGRFASAAPSSPPPASSAPAPSPRGPLRAAGLAALATLAAEAVFAITVLRDAEGWGGLYAAMVPLVALAAGVPGLAYGVASGAIRTSRDAAEAVAAAIAGMSGYIVLAFVAAQFVAWFAWSNLGLVLAVRGAEWLRGMDGLALLLALVVASGLVNIVIASASAKWAILAPVFVPMMMLLGLSPELTQAAYRVGDAVTNISTPLLPYIPILLETARRYRRDAGLGTVLAAQVPYAAALGIAWTAMLLGWWALGWPLGPGAALGWEPGTSPPPR